MAEKELKIQIKYPWYLKVQVFLTLHLSVMVWYLLMAYQGFLLVVFKIKTNKYSDEWVEVHLYRFLLWLLRSQLKTKIIKNEKPSKLEGSY